MDDSFIKARNITYDRFVFFSSKQQGRESAQSFYETLIEEIENCSRGNEDTTLIRDTFNCNIRDNDTQKELHKEAVTPTKALQLTIHMEVGFKQQMGNSHIKKTKTQTLLTLSPLIEFKSLKIVLTTQTFINSDKISTGRKKPANKMNSPKTVTAADNVGTTTIDKITLRKAKTVLALCGVSKHIAETYRKAKRTQYQTSPSQQTNNKLNPVGQK